MHLDYAVPRIPLLPERRPSSMEIAGRDGKVDFANDSYAPRLIPVDCLLRASSDAELTARLADIAAWLSGTGYLIFDHDTTKRWTAKVYSGIDQNRIPKAAQFTVVFEVEPYAEDVTETEDTTLGSAEDYGSDVIFYPEIEITLGAVSTYVQVSLAAGELVRVEDSFIADDVVLINMSTGKVTKNGSNCMDKVTLASLFFGVPTGSQTITVTAAGAHTETMTYRKRYLYA
jgi:predicted phage tail component-like protein